MTSTSIPLVNLSEENEVTVVTRWDAKLRKKGSYKLAVNILSSRKYGAPSLAVVREWLEEIVHQPFRDFFLNRSEQAKSFNYLKKVFVSKCTSKTARFRKWTVDFVSDKMALLIELNKQVANEKTVREKEKGGVGHAPPKTKLRCAILKLVKEYSESCRASRYVPRQNSSFQLTKRASHLTTLNSKQPLDFQKDKTNNIKQEARLLT